MDEIHQFVKVEFRRFKAFEIFTLELRKFNILVGPNNAGKSTILAAFRILAAGLRRANSRVPSWVQGPNGLASGYKVDMTAISVAEENIFFDYKEDEGASVTFHLSNKNALILYFPSGGGCSLLLETSGKPVQTTKAFRKNFNFPIGFVPILGPVEHHEALYERETARNSLYNYRAARNFRNIWYHISDRFDEFKDLLEKTWPGMTIDRPGVDIVDSKSRLHMMCRENRILREIFWSGFGFQVWCQMLTHLVQSREVSIFLIDEPDIYLHSDLQRQLLGILRELGPDILVATHSTEIITEAEADDMILINKANKRGRRIRSATQLHDVLKSLGSRVNPILTQLAKTRRVLFVEGQDFHIIGRFARKVGSTALGNQRDFAVVAVEGFNPERAKNLKSNMEKTLGTKIVSAVVLDKDYRSDDECSAIKKDCETFSNFVAIHCRKEIENFLLVPSAIDRAIAQRVADRERRSGKSIPNDFDTNKRLGVFAQAQKNYVFSRFSYKDKQFGRLQSRTEHEAIQTERVLTAFEDRWTLNNDKFSMICGKEALSFINKEVQEKCGVSLTPTAIIDAMKIDEIPDEMKSLLKKLEEFVLTSA